MSASAGASSCCRPLQIQTPSGIGWAGEAKDAHEATRRVGNKTVRLSKPGRASGIADWCGHHHRQLGNRSVDVLQRRATCRRVIEWGEPRGNDLAGKLMKRDNKEEASPRAIPSRHLGARTGHLPNMSLVRGRMTAAWGKPVSSSVIGADAGSMMAGRSRR